MTDIAFFLVNLSGGGAEKVMLTLADGFAKQGFKVDMVIAVLSGDYLSMLSSNITVVDLKSRRLISSLLPLVNYLRRYRPKVLISALEDPNTIAILAKYLAGNFTATILTLHNNLSCSAQYSTSLKSRLIPLFARLCLPLADAVVAVSQGVAIDAAKISRLPIEKIKVIYNPIFTDELLPKLEEQIEHSWCAKNQPSLILGVGRLTKQKDFPTLIRAFSLVKQKYPCRLMILGQGEELAELQTLVNQLNLTTDVMFPGFVANPYAYMKSASLVVLSSIYEGFGNVLVEAMLAGTPVVSTDCESGPSEILDRGRYGSLVAVGDVSTLATAMLNTLKNPLSSSNLVQRGEEFSLSSSLLKYREVINNILLNKRGM